MKWNDACSNIVANILLADPQPPPTLGMGSKFNYFKNMVMLHIKSTKWNHECNNDANVLPVDLPRPWSGGGGGGRGQKVKIQLFQNIVMLLYQVKWNRECSKMQTHSLSLHTPSIPGVASKVKTFFSSKSSHVACQIGREWIIEHIASTKFDPYTHPRPLGWGQRSKHLFSESRHFAYKIKGNGV